MLISATRPKGNCGSKESAREPPIGDVISEPKRFEWLSFIVRQVPVMTVVTLWLVKQVKAGDLTGPIVLSCFLLLVLTAWNYVRCRRP
jgi:hypothetical protein